MGLVEVRGQSESMSPPVSTVTDQDTRRMIKLRASNEALFTGKRNAAKGAWR